MADSPLTPADVTLVLCPGGQDAAVYVHGDLTDTGHTEDVMERLVTRLGIRVEHADFITDKDAPGWSGAASTLSEALGK